MSNLFVVTNHQCEDCGDPPALPADFDSGPYRRGYYENIHGEQWLFLAHLETHEIWLYGGDCGWDMRLTVRRVDVGDLLKAMVKRPPFVGQWLAAGKVKVMRLMDVDLTLATTLIVTSDKGETVALGEGEYTWLESCLKSLRNPPPKMTAAEIRKLVDDLVERSKTKQDEDDDATA